ncbi:Os06g0699050 [Oryza sativa Japonica Group]|uniref:Os06g0699050 protein n=1 Tax=Oryza sativa subsp. japonica TaxID=39947 RepID=A0A0P0X122_ORYSJ|nr:hypothetical protein EE612_036287 [Oryza sativa]BAS99323.1 Os06g0699050 [Oryza sativa Japonica Group]
MRGITLAGFPPPKSIPSRPRPAQLDTYRRCIGPTKSPSPPPPSTPCFPLSLFRRSSSGIRSLASLTSFTTSTMSPYATASAVDATTCRVMQLP